MTDHPTPQDLEAFAYEAAEPPRDALVRRHVDACPDCRQTVELEREERKTLIRALKPEPAERTAFAVESFEAKPPRETTARLLAAIAATVLLVSAVWMSLPGGRAPSSVKQNAPDPEWRFPVQLGRVPLATAGLRSAFRTPGGMVGVVFNQTLYYSPDLSGALKRIDIIMIDPCSDLRVEGESVLFVMLLEGRITLIKVDFADAAKVSKTDLGVPAGGFPVALELGGRGEFRIALAEMRSAEGPGTILASRSLDSGRTWGLWREVARGVQTRGQRGLLATSLGAEVYYATSSGALACVRSVDHGETWTAAEGIPTAPYAIADYVRVAPTEGRVHLVYSGAKPGGGFDLVHLSRENGGGSWSAPVILGPLPSPFGIHPAVRDQYQLRSAGGSLFCSTGSMAGLGEAAQLYMSRDGGKSWRREEEAVRGLRSRPWAGLACEGASGILLALDVALPEGGGDHLLLREYTASPGPGRPDPAPVWWKSGK